MPDGLDGIDYGDSPVSVSHLLSPFHSVCVFKCVPHPRPSVSQIITDAKGLRYPQNSLPNVSHSEVILS